MKIKNLIHALVIPIFIFASCGKGNDPTPVTPATPITITEFYPQKMITGRELTIIGTNFDVVAANNIVKINGVAATVSSATATTVIVTIPTAATSGKITINKGALSATSSADFTVMNNPYQNVRVKGVYNETNKRRDLYFYDSANRLTAIKYYVTNALGIEYQEGLFTYSYTTNGKLDKTVYESISPASKIKSVNQYAYLNDVLSTVTNSNLDETNPSATVITITDINKYDFLKGQVNAIISSNAQGQVAGVYKYAYSVLDGNPKMIVTNTADASAQSPVLNTTTTVEYADVLSPVSLITPYVLQPSILFTKSQVFSNVVGTYSYSYTLDTSGKIATTTVNQALTGTSTRTYTYENKN
jgi:hypothetical protein